MRSSQDPRSIGVGLSRREVIKRGAGVTLAALAGPQVLAACAPGTTAPPTQSQAAEQAVKGGTITEGFTTGVAGLNPVLFAGTVDLKVQNLLFSSLLVPGINGNPSPLLAQAMPKLSADGRTYTFELRKDAKWTDGKPVSADDVAYTYQLMSHADYKDVKSPFRSELSALVADVKATDPTTVVITLKQPSASFLTNHSQRLIVPKHVLGALAPAAFNTDNFTRAPAVTCGPFKFQELVSGDHITCVRNVDYFRGAPNLERYIGKFVSADNVIQQLKTGGIDVYIANTFASYAELAASPNLNFQTFDAPGPHFYYNLDPKRPSYRIFSSKAVRKALIYAMDRPGAVKAVLFGYGSVHKSSGVYPPYSFANNPEGKPDYPYDKKKAEDLLDADGWKMGAGGVRQKDGAPLKLEVVTSAESKEWQGVMSVAQQNWKDIGVDVSVRLAPFAQMTADIMINHSFDMTLSLSPSFFSPDPDIAARLQSRNAVPGGSNWGNYANPQLDQLLDQGATEADQAKRKEIYFKVQDILNEEVPSWSPQFWKRAWVANKRVKNMVAGTQIGVYGYVGTIIHQAWVTDGK